MTDQGEWHVRDQKGDQTGRPLSNVLFNTDLQVALNDDYPRWQKKKKERAFA